MFRLSGNLFLKFFFYLLLKITSLANSLQFFLMPFFSFFSSVNWLFLLSICLAKTVVFALVSVITLLVQRPTNYSKAGIYSIFCTQSNDFALGYPIGMLWLDVVLDGCWSREVLCATPAWL